MITGLLPKNVKFSFISSIIFPFNFYISFMKKQDWHSDEAEKENNVEIISNIFVLILDYLVAKVFYDKIFNSIKSRNNINFLKKDIVLLKLHEYLDSRLHFTYISYHPDIEIQINKNGAFENSSDFDSFFTELSDFDNIFQQDKDKLLNFVSVIKESININLFSRSLFMIEKSYTPLINAFYSLEDIYANLDEQLNILSKLEKNDEYKKNLISSNNMAFILDSYCRTFFSYIDKISRLFYSLFLTYGHFFVLSLIKDNIGKQNDTSKKSHKKIESLFFSEKRPKMSDFPRFVRKNIMIHLTNHSFFKQYNEALDLFQEIIVNRNKIMHNPYHGLNYGDTADSRSNSELIDNFLKKIDKIDNTIIQLLKLIEEFNDTEKFKKNDFYKNFLKELNELDLPDESLDILMSVYKTNNSKSYIDFFWKV